MNDPISKLTLPPGVCDCHMHVYGPADRYPVAPTNAIPVPAQATIADYRKAMTRVGIQRAVIVQPSAYGTDNRCTLDGMKALGDNARGVAVVDTTVTDAELARLTQAGIRGLRFHMLAGGVLPWEILETMAVRVRPFGWHIQLQMDGRHLPEREAVLKRLPTELVVDHIGRFFEPVTIEHPGFRTLVRLVEGGRCWVKLSMPYEASRSGPPHYDDIGVLAKVLIRAAPERMVWASNWPHPNVSQDNRPDDAVLLRALLAWARDEATAKRILVDNPARLYGFDTPIG
ncbi:MAG: amidohydrolase family protein [Gammaproteobacteria bacterium]